MPLPNCSALSLHRAVVATGAVGERKIAEYSESIRLRIVEVQEHFLGYAKVVEARLKQVDSFLRSIEDNGWDRESQEKRMSLIEHTAMLVQYLDETLRYWEYEYNYAVQQRFDDWHASKPKPTASEEEQLKQHTYRLLNELIKLIPVVRDYSNDVFDAQQRLWNKDPDTSSLEDSQNKQRLVDQLTERLKARGGPIGSAYREQHAAY